MTPLGPHITDVLLYKASIRHDIFKQHCRVEYSARNIPREDLTDSWRMRK